MLRFLLEKSPLSATRGSLARRSSTRAAVKQEPNGRAKGRVEFSKGGLYHGFVCTDVQPIREFNMTAVALRHERSRTEYLHLQRDDPNNVFSINFRTTPFDSTGLPHILEHTALCGSAEYPVRDPFFKMLNRSLATFMNAMTGPDYTFYPFSSQNEVDYRNLQGIYLDAVFRPNLNELDFLQEGWRLEHSDLKDPESELGFKGVVFNEMKGVFSENRAIFGEKFLNAIVPDHTYGYVSGGDPLEIPNLTVADLRDFHKKYYHPSNAKIFSYGNFPLERNLEICDRSYLRDCEAIDSSYSKVPAQPRWNSPVEKSITCRFDKMGAPIEKQNQIAIGYLMSDITNVYDTFTLQVLSELMLMGPNSLFYKSLIEPNISGGYNSLTGYDAQIKDTMFVVGLQDIETQKFEMVKQIFDETIDKVISEGFNKAHVDGVLHRIELGIKHQSTNFGLNTLFNLVPLWNHGGPLMEALRVENFLGKLKKNIENPTYLSGMVEKYFKSNNHKLTMTMVPDSEYEEKIARLEENLLKEKVSSLGEEDKRDIFEKGLKLSESQKTQENVDSLPCLGIDDIAKDIPTSNLKNVHLNKIPAQVCKANTNNVTYFKGILDTSTMPENLKYLLPIFNATVTKMNTKNYNYRDFDTLINLKTGGIGFSTHVGDRLDNAGHYEQGVLISSHCLDSNLDGMLSIWTEIFKKPLFNDVDRFKMLFDSYVSDLTPGVASSGHFYAMQVANSLVTSGSLFREKLSGMKHIEHIKNINKVEPIEKIMEKMTLISEYLLDGSKMRMAVNTTNDVDSIQKFDNFTKVLSQSNADSSKQLSLSSDKTLEEELNCIHYLTNFSVNYCAKSIAVVPFAHKDYSKLRVLAKFLTSKYLHPVVREQNGAYGGGAKVSNNGLFTFYSYRDPNSRVTLDVFDKSGDWLKNCSKDILNEQAIFESKLGVLQQIDAPVAEYNKGIEEFMYGLSTDMLRNHRNDVLNVTKEDLLEVCDKYLNGKSTVGKCVIGPRGSGENELIAREEERWKVVQPESDA